MYAKGVGSPNRNFRLGVYNGILVNGAEAFFHSSLVLAPFLATLGTPAYLIGLIPALRVGGWLLPQLFVASRLAHEPFKLPWYWRMSLVRFIAFTLMVVAVFGFGDSQLTVVVVLAMITVNAVASGVSGVSFADVTAKVVPHYRLGTFWVLRNVIGGALALLAGLVLRSVLSSEIAFPTNFGYLFLIGTVVYGGAYLAFSLIREPAGAPVTKQPFIGMVRRVPGLLRQNNSFRRYMLVRFLALLALFAEPFYAIYALQRLDAPASSLGLFVILATFASVAANLALRKAADSARNVFILQLSVGLLLAAPVAALLMPTWQAFSAVFMLSAAGQAGMGIAAWNLLYAVSPEEERLMYVGTANTILSLPSFAPILAGGVVELLGFQMTFAFAAVVAVAAFALVFGLGGLRDLDRAALEHASA